MNLQKGRLFVATAACFFPAASMAQTVTAGRSLVSDPAATSKGAGNEIVVTARKREERLIDVPLSISVVGAESIDRANLVNVSDVARLTPGFSYKQGFGRTGGGSGAGVRPSVRGMSSVVGAPNAAFFVDGVFVSDNIASYQLENIERVEVIKGPQSALFGRGTFAGAINFVTRRPSNEFTGRIKVSAAQFNDFEVSGYISGPIVKDILRFEINARKYSFGGDYVNASSGDRDIGAQQSFNIGGRLLFSPSDNFEALASFGYSKDRDTAYAYNPQGSLANNCYAPPIVATVPFPRTNTSRRGFYCGEVNTLPTYFANNKALEALGYSGLDREFYRSNLTMSFTTDGGTKLTSTTAYNHNFSITGQDNATLVTAVPSFAIDGSQTNDFSQELRIASSPTKPLRASLGAYLYRERVLPGFEVNAATNTQRPYESPNGVLSRSVFGMVEWDATRRLTLSAEARYQNDRITGSTRVLGPAGGPAGIATNVREVTFNDVLPRFAARYKLDEDLNLYATAAKGNKPGGFNTFPTDATATDIATFTTAGFATFDEESAWSYELGIKGRRGGINFAMSAFYTDWSKQQLSRGEAYTRLTGTPNSVVFIQNAGQSRIKGFEIDVSGNPVTWLFLRAAYTYVDARFTRFYDDTTEEIYDTDGRPSFIKGVRNPLDVDGPTGDVSGNRLPQTPQHQAVVTAEITRPINDNLSFIGRGDLAYESKRYSQVDNLNWAGDSFNLNASLGLQSVHWTISFFARNLLQDKTPLVVTRILDFNRLLTRVNPLTGLNQTTFFRDFFVSAPRRRQFGINASYKF